MGAEAEVQELVEPFEGRLGPEGMVEIDDAKAKEFLRGKGYGIERDGRFLLYDYEALYLAYTGKLKVKRPGKKGSRRGDEVKDEHLSTDELVELALAKDPRAWTRFLIYRDLRSRGYVAREGFGFGVDFRLYDKGEFGEKPSRYVVFGLNEGTEMRVRDFSNFVDQIITMGKMPIIAVIERRGEVIYYKLSKMRFQRH